MMLCSKNGALHNPSTALFCTITALCLLEYPRFAGVFSLSTIVGYQTRAVDAGFSLSTPAFKAIGGDYNLQDLKLGADAVGDGSEQIQVLDTEGTVSSTYIWLNQTGVSMPDGWYDFNTWEPITATIPAGNGFLMGAQSEMNITTSGEVASDETTVDVPAGFSVLGNCSPVDISIQDMKLDAGAVGDGSEQIQVLGADGTVSVTYIWLNQTGVGMPDGWYDFNTWEPIVATVKAGEAFLFGTGAATKLTIPSAIK